MRKCANKSFGVLPWVNAQRNHSGDTTALAGLKQENADMTGVLMCCWANSCSRASNWGHRNLTPTFQRAKRTPNLGLSPGFQHQKMVDGRRYARRVKNIYMRLPQMREKSRRLLLCQRRKPGGDLLKTAMLSHIVQLLQTKRGKKTGAR